jgi:methyl-accepting chemotaxis protein
MGMNSPKNHLKIKYKLLIVSFLPFFILLVLTLFLAKNDLNRYFDAIYSKEAIQLLNAGGEAIEATLNRNEIDVNKKVNTENELTQNKESIFLKKLNEIKKYEKGSELYEHFTPFIPYFSPNQATSKKKDLSPLQRFTLSEDKNRKMLEGLSEIIHTENNSSILRLMLQYVFSLKYEIVNSKENSIILTIAKDPEKKGEYISALHQAEGKTELLNTLLSTLGTDTEDQHYQMLKNDQSFADAQEIKNQLLQDPNYNVDLTKWNSLEIDMKKQFKNLRDTLFNEMTTVAEVNQRENFIAFLTIAVAILLTIPFTIFLIFWSLKKIGKQLESEVVRLKDSGEKILGSLTEASSGTTETASSVAETTTTVEELKQTAEIATQNACHVADVSQSTLSSLKEVEKHLQQHMDGMNKIEDGMNTISNTIVQLSDQSLTIGNIIDTVDDLAEQSHLLAINAAIEAAKAKEHGKGFGVVAQEIRSLAEQSKQATIQVRKILNEIKNSTSSAVMATEQGSKAVKFGMQFSTTMNGTVKTLSENITKAADATDQISQNSQQQLVGVNQVTVAMRNIKEASNEHVKQIDSIQEALSEMNQVCGSLNQLIEEIKV